VRERDLVLGANVLAALNAVNAWRPFDRRHFPSAYCFAAGWPTSELPMQALAAHLALTGVAAARGDLQGRRGLAAAALSAATAASLGAAYRVAKTAGDVYEQALRDGLGPDYRDDIAQLKFPGDDAADARTPGVVRMMRIRRRFAHRADIQYGPARRANLLDIWSRDDLPSDASAPVLIQIPGGGWTIGNKQAQAYPLMSHLAERGWVCVAINYRLSPKNRWPAHIVDVKRAIAWVRANIASYGGDPDFIALTGGSAGGHLCSLAALTPGEREWQPDFEDADTSVAACVPFYGAYDVTDREGVGHRSMGKHLERLVIGAKRANDPDAFDRASPMSRINADAPPFLISHGTNDSLIPVEEGRLFARLLREVSKAPVVYAELPRAQHAFDIFGTPRANQAAEAVARFLGHVYGKYLAGQDVPAAAG
jgi:acetyl esterase/lipase